jgi:hypothetical protein
MDHAGELTTFDCVDHATSINIQVFIVHFFTQEMHVRPPNEQKI